MNSPFKFLDAYRREDRAIFFGRDQEIEDLYETSFKTDLMLVYGQSGTGKTSLIQCGLANRFRETDWFDLRIRRWDDINQSLLRKIRDEAQTPIAEDAGVCQAIQSLYLDYLKPIYLIFDQFEELFILGTPDERQAFFNTIAEMAESNGKTGHARVCCKILFVMREEYIAWLYDFEKIVPHLFNHRIRVEAMNQSNVEAVIRGSAKAFKINLEEASETVSRIIDYNKDHKGIIHLPYLQVYLDRLYREAAAMGEPVAFHPGLVDKVGQIEDVMAVFLAEQTVQIQERVRQAFPDAPPNQVWNVLDQFVTVEGTNSPLTKDTLHDRAPQSKEVIDFCLEQMEESRILSSSEHGRSYEIAHDALARCIDDKRTAEEKTFLKVEKLAQDRYSSFKATESLLTEGELQYIAPHEEKLKERLDTTVFNFVERSKLMAAKHRSRLTIISIAIAVLFAILGSVSVWKWIQADKRSGAAEANLRVAKAQLVADEDPTLALRLTEKALELGKSQSIKLATQKLYLKNSFYKVIATQPSGITSAALSPDGSEILTGSWDGSIQIWGKNGKNGTPILNIKNSKDDVTSVAFSPDGELILAGSMDGTVKIWNRMAEAVFTKAGLEYVSSVAFSPDGEYVLCGSSDNTARLWHLENAEPERIFKHDHEVTSVAFSPKARLFITGSRDKTARIWDYENNFKKELYHGYSVTCAAFSPDGKHVLTGSEDNNARLWSLETWRVQQVFPHDGSIQQVAFSPDGDLVLTASKDKTARIWDFKGTLLYILKGHKETVTAFLYHPETENIITVSQDKTLRRWYIHRELEKVLKHPDGIECLAYSPNGMHIFTGSFDNIGRLWSTDGRLVREFKHRDVVEAALFLPDNKHILTASADNHVRLWDYGARVIRSVKLEDSIESLALSPDSVYFLTGTTNGNVALWQLKDPAGQEFKKEWDRAYPGSSIESVRFSPPEGKRIFIGINRGISSPGIILDLDGDLIEKIDNTDGLESAVYSPDGQSVFIGRSSGEGCLWSVQGSKIICGFKHHNIIEAADFSPNGKFILTGSKDGSACLWNLKGDLLQLYYHMQEVEAVAFSPHGNRVVTGSKDKTARIWKINPLSLESFLESGHLQEFTEEELKDLAKKQ